MIIDTQMHFNKPETPRGKGPADYKVLTKQEGVTGAILLDEQEFALNLAAEEPLIVGVVGRVDYTPQFGKEIEKWGANPLFRGNRCTGVELETLDQDGGFLSCMKIMAERGLVLDLYRICGGGEAVTKVFYNGPKALSGYFGNQHSLSCLEKLSAHLPNLCIVIRHIAHYPIDGKPMNKIWQENFRRIAALPNVYMKVSGLMERFVVTEHERAPETLSYYRSTLDMIWDTFGEDRLMYGSDWPVCEHSGDFIVNGIHIVRAYFAEKGEEASRKFFWKNSKKAYQWEPRLPSQR